ncbi:hypothetical protein RHMOL_Rhmol04G0167700 [Rhododendron molle]|uniref:Uncharacterized protein n=1 Tax=Rhododendron molle TaxID=49168 RepID=A0ACC0P2G6_RHOML|nr:hypothetical protein RHMOL_Rhmol04G0167700 [Rhododendron molle]
MAAQMELAELKKAVEELGHKMDKQMIMVQGLVGLFTSTAQQSDMGLVKEPSQAYHPPMVGIKLCSGDMFKDLAEFHEARTYPNEDVGSLFTTIAEGEDTLRDDFYPESKRMHHIDEDMCCNCKANRGPALNSQSSRRNQPRTFTCFTAPLASVYEKLLDAGSIKPLNPTSLPKNPPANFKYNLYCTNHQTPGHSTNACFRLRHAIQDLTDCGIIPAPSPSKVDTVSKCLPQLNSGSQIGQTSTISIQINPTSTQINPSSKPIVPIPSEPEDSLLAAVCALGTFSASTKIDNDEGLTNGKTDWLRSTDQRSIE